jgi:hypothetical protein
MNINVKELNSLRTMLETYKQEYGTVAADYAESVNCYCGGSCTGSCNRYCDGGGNVCWRASYR